MITRVYQRSSRKYYNNDVRMYYTMYCHGGVLSVCGERARCAGRRFATGRRYGWNATVAGAADCGGVWLLLLLLLLPTPTPRPP